MWHRSMEEVDAGYANWRDGQPDNHEDDEGCLSLHKDGFDWNDKTCADELSGICEREPVYV